MLSVCFQYRGDTNVVPLSETQIGKVIKCWRDDRTAVTHVTAWRQLDGSWVWNFKRGEDWNTSNDPPANNDSRHWICTFRMHSSCGKLQCVYMNFGSTGRKTEWLWFEWATFCISSSKVKLHRQCRVIVSMPQRATLVIFQTEDLIIQV